jgi:hypothetical protein
VAINIAILAANEYQELDRLLQCLIIDCKFDIDNIVIVLDGSKTTYQMIELIESYNILYKIRPLNGNFAEQRNYLQKLCTQPHILHIDVDETINIDLLNMIYETIKTKNFDIAAIPRVNKLIMDDPNITVEEIFGTTALDQQGRINWPDYQWRLIKNESYLQWQNKINERLNGRIPITLPADETIAISHIKKISKQLQQRNYYLTIQK